MSDSTSSGGNTGRNGGRAGGSASGGGSGSAPGRDSGGGSRAGRGSGAGRSSGSGGGRGGSGARARGDRGRGDNSLWTREGKPARGDRDAHKREEELTEQERIARELKSVRPRHDAPDIPDEITGNELDRVARNELKTLSKENADGVARHLVMASQLIDSDPELAHRHAQSAARRAGRIAIVRETLAITAYATGDFALALRELRTYRRISGSDNELPLMVDSERGVGRPDRALELGRSVDRSRLPNDVQAALAIAMSGARLDQGDPDAALVELEIPQLDPNRAYPYSPELYSAYAEVLDELGRADEAARWRALSDRADAALAEASGDNAEEAELVEIVEEDILDEDGVDGSSAHEDGAASATARDAGDAEAAGEETEGHGGDVRE